MNLGREVSFFKAFSNFFSEFGFISAVFIVSIFFLLNVSFFTSSVEQALDIQGRFVMMFLICLVFLVLSLILTPLVVRKYFVSGVNNGWRAFFSYFFFLFVSLGVFTLGSMVGVSDLFGVNFVYFFYYFAVSFYESLVFSLFLFFNLFHVVKNVFVSNFLVSFLFAFYHFFVYGGNVFYLLFAFFLNFFFVFLVQKGTILGFATFPGVVAFHQVLDLFARGFIGG